MFIFNLLSGTIQWWWASSCHLFLMGCFTTNQGGVLIHFALLQWQSSKLGRRMMNLGKTINLRNQHFQFPLQESGGCYSLSMFCFSVVVFFDFEGAWHGSSSRWKSTWRMPKLGETFVKSGLPISTWGKLGNGWKWWKLRILFQNYDYTCWWKLGNFGAWLQYMMFFNDYMVECLRHCGLKWIRVLRSAKRIMSYSCIPSGNRT